MKTLQIKISLLLIFFFINSNNLFSQNINDALRLGESGLGSNARALGMGNSYTALSDDNAAAFFNPAGFGLINKIEVSGAFNYSKITNNVSFFNSTSASSNSETELSKFSLVLPIPTFRGSLVFGLSFNKVKNFNSTLNFDSFNPNSNSLIQSLLNTDIPFDLYLTDPNNNTIINGKLNQSGSILSSGSLDNYTISGAIEISPGLFVGLNLNLADGNFQSNNDFYEDDFKGLYQGELSPGEADTRDFQSFHLNRLLNWNFTGWDAKAGFLYQIEDKVRFGATVQFPKFYKIEEDFLVSGESQFGSGITFELDPTKFSDRVKYDIQTPFEFSAGGSVSINGLILSSDITFIDFTQMEFDNPEGLSQQYIADINKNIKSSLRNVLNYNFGLEYIIPGTNVRVRGGYFTKSSAYDNDPTDFDKKFASAGVGFLLNKSVSIDAAYIHGWWKTFGDNYDVNVSRTFQDLKLDQVVLNIAYRF